MEHRYSVLRTHLDELGYRQPLVIEAVPLVERLLADLVKTTESLYHYKNVAQTAIEERDHLQLGAEPYKCDNAKLVKECNDLHLAFVQFREQTDKLQKDLKHRINTLEKDNEELIHLVENLQKVTEKTKIDTKRKTNRTTVTSADKTKLLKKPDTSRGKTNETENTMACQKLTELSREVKKLRADLAKNSEQCDCLKNKINSRDKEIQRLNSLLEGGRPLQALNKDCCYKDVNSRLCKLSEDNDLLAREKKDYEIQLAEAISKQHEAMKRALHLADRNKELERELRDIDKMALAVEAECNSTVRQNVTRVSKYQEQLESCKSKIDGLERELAESARSKKKCEMELHNVREEKSNLKMILENALEDKKRMNDRINQFTRIEHDLNLEIDRLVQTSTLQKRKITELECQIVSGQFQRGIDEVDDNRYKKSSSLDKCNCCEKCIGKKLETPRKSPAVPVENTAKIEKIQNEKDFYMCECQKLRNEIKILSQRSNTGSDLNRKLNEKDEVVTRLERENRDLTRDKHNLLAKLESFKEMKDWGDNMGSSSIKSVLSRTEKERDLARGDIKRLEDERESLRRRLKTSTETHVVERDRLSKLMNESEEKLRKLESDRREMMTVQGSRRATINNLEEQIETLTTQLRTTQSELDHIHTLYSQVKTLQEQTDNSLADAQGQLTQIEMQHAHGQERIRELERNRAELDKEVSILKNDICVLKGNLAKIDCERDNLLIEVDNKTERLAALEQELKAKENKMINLETAVTELKQQLSLTADDKSTRDYLLKNSSHEVSTLKRELDDAKKTKANALIENRRIQEDLARVTLDWRTVNGELARAMREIEDLKTQLQQYVFEIKRAEDLISKKENERAEMLDQFRSLSHEATMLENNNHTLETKAFETQTQLTVAQDQVTDLENKVEQQATLNRDYEKQIHQLTGQIASLETQIRQHASYNSKTETDLAAVKCLCVKLDEQKDKLIREASEKEGYKSHLEREKERLRVEIEQLQNTLDKEQSNLGSLENLLSASRQETVEQRLMNQELHAEVQRLKGIVEDLQTKVSAVREQNNETVFDIDISTPCRKCCLKCNCKTSALDNPKDFKMGELGYNFLTTASTQTLLASKPKKNTSLKSAVEKCACYSKCSCKDTALKAQITSKKSTSLKSPREKFKCCTKCSCVDSALKTKISPKLYGDKEVGELGYNFIATESTQTLLSSKPKKTVSQKHKCAPNCDCETPLLEIKPKHDYGELDQEFEQRFANQSPPRTSFSAGTSPRKTSRGIMKCCQKCNCKNSNTNSPRDYLNKDFEIISAISTSPEATQAQARFTKSYQEDSDEKSTSSSNNSNTKKDYVKFKMYN